MDYTALIQNRKSARGFTDVQVTEAQFAEIRSYYEKSAQKLIPDMKTKMVIAGFGAQRELEGAAGYENMLIGAPAYLAIMAEDAEGAIENGCYILEDLVLKLEDMGLGSCYITFADGERIKAAIESATRSFDNEYEGMVVAGLIAFGNTKTMAKRMRFNFLTMANIGTKEKKHYFDPKKRVDDVTYMNTWGNTDGVDEFIGFYDEILWEALYAAVQSPSYLNRQPYEFILKEHEAILVSTPDEFTDPISEKQNLGIVMLHFAAAASETSGTPLTFRLNNDAEGLRLPEGYKVVARIVL